MKPSLIACDLDGTLMAPDHLTVTKRTYNALFSAHEKGVKIAIATGRTLGFTDSVTEQIPFVDYVIFSNGACVYDRKAGKNIYENMLSVAQTDEILSLLEPLELYYNAYSGGKIFTQKNKERFYTNDTLPQEFLEMFLRCATECDNMKQALSGKQAEIVAMYSMNESQKAFLYGHFERMKLHITSSLDNEFEVTAPSVNKGTAIKGLCKAAGIDTETVMAFGDAMNDYEMLEAVGMSYAMGNGCEELKAAAKHVALSNAEDGVAVEIEKVIE